MSRFLISFSAAVFLAACATSSSPDVQTQQRAFAETEAPDPSPLDAYAIPPGRCGMILWTQNGSRIAPIFRSVDVTTATMRIEGEEMPLLLQSQDGELRLGMRAKQVFAATGESNGGVVVEAKLNWGQAFPGGSYVSGGTLTVIGADGWRRILPVAGIAGCKA